MNPRSVFAFLALVCAAVGAAPAAASPPQVPTGRISIADLNLASPAGRAMLERRVNAAADNACRVNGRTHLNSLRAGEACFAKVVDQAIE